MYLKKDNILILSLNDKLGGAEQVLKMIALYHDMNIKINVFFFCCMDVA